MPRADRQIPTTPGLGPRVGVIVGGDHDESMISTGRVLAEQLGLALVEEARSGEYDLLLELTADRLALRTGGGERPMRLAADFLGGSGGQKRKSVAGARQPLARAVGLRGAPLFVLDATAGLARDAFQLARWGCTVLAVERSPILAALVRDGLGRAASAGDPRFAPVLARLTLVMGDARQVLRSEPIEARPDVVYLDPMYPQRTKSALVKKEMRICRTLIGDDADASELFALARETARQRVVVKRHRHAPPLGAKPDIRFAGRVVRYDVYLTGGHKTE